MLGKARCHSQSPPLPAHLLQTMSPEDLQGPQGAAVPRMPNPGVWQHRGAAGQPAARAPSGRRALRAEPWERGLLPQARRAGLAGRQEEQDSPQRSAGQPVPTRAQYQNPHGWGKKDLLCSYPVHLEVGFACASSEGLSLSVTFQRGAARIPEGEVSVGSDPSTEIRWDPDLSNPSCDS